MLGSREDFAQADGPNASLDYGGATQMADLGKQATAFGSGQPAPGGAPPSPGQAQAAAGASEPAPAQPAPPRVPMTPDRVESEVFSDPPTGHVAWREGLRTLAAHPKAGPMLAALARHADSGQ